MEKSNESTKNSETSDMPEELDKKTRGKRKRITTEIETPEYAEGRLTDCEKIDLFNALIQHGSSNISLLQTFVPNKSEDNLRRFVRVNKRVARYTISEGQTKAPIDKWLEFLSGDEERDREKLSDLSRALKYISLFEPCASKYETMISDCYKLVSDCLIGDGPKHLNPVTSLFLHRQLQQLIRLFKSQDFDIEHKYLDNYNKKKACYSGKKKISDGGSQLESRISNPLKIPDSLLELKK